MTTTAWLCNYLARVARCNASGVAAAVAVVVATLKARLLCGASEWWRALTSSGDGEDAIEHASALCEPRVARRRRPVWSRASRTLPSPPVVVRHRRRRRRGCGRRRAYRAPIAHALSCPLVSRSPSSARLPARRLTPSVDSRARMARHVVMSQNVRSDCCIEMANVQPRSRGSES